ncbi:MAG: transketolase, partial [Pseudomonadota bacterium]
MELDQMKARDPRRFAMANALRALALDAVKAANSGHSGMPMGMADVATVLFDTCYSFNPDQPEWPDRDRLVLSAGHGSMLLYGLLYLSGYPDMTIQQIRNFRQLGAATAGHPEFGHAPGIETTTGPLGQGIATAVGMAIAEENLRARFGRRVFDHKTWVIAGDGCLMEGVSQEAITLAGRQQLKNLIVLWDNNGISIDGKVELSDRTNQIARFEASGWTTRSIDGHNTTEIEATLNWATRQRQPVMISCRTQIGIGAPNAEGTAKAHGAITKDEEIADAKKAYDWPYAPFDIPEEIMTDWRATAERGREAFAEWRVRLADLPEARQDAITRVMSGERPERLTTHMRRLKRRLVEEAPKLATRAASEEALKVINPIMTETMGGSADLTGSNNTLTHDMGVFDVKNRKGRYIYFGIREHGMAAALNGMALHGGVVPYGGTFLVFSDYARAAMRLSALMGQKVIYVMTHDSIGLGEDGPTHQPVEHLASLRAIPGLT